MIKKNLLLLSFLILTPGQFTSSQAFSEKPQIFFLGTLHQFHLDPTWGYSLARLESSVRDLQPDLICGEVDPRDFGNEMEGFAPPEVVFLDELAKDIQATFVAVDWRGSYSDQLEADKLISASARTEIEKAQIALKDSFPQNPDHMFEFLHSKKTGSSIKKIHEMLIRAGTEIADTFWLARNQMIAKNCLKAAENLQKKRLLLTFGIDHKYILEEEFQERNNFEFLPTPLKASSAVRDVTPSTIHRWKQNKANLERLIADPRTTEIDKRMLKDSGRVEEIEKFIRAYDRAPNR